MLYLQPAQLAEKCFLQEVLYWMSFARLPVATYSNSGKDVRDDPETLEYEALSPDGEYLEDEECSFAGIPRDPRMVALLDENRSYLPDEFYVKWLSEAGDSEYLERLKKDRLAAQAHRDECEAWMPNYERVVEYPKSQIFVALKGGHLQARGRRLPSVNLEESLDLLKDQERYVMGLPLTAIPASFWSLQGTDFTYSAAKSDTVHYCHIQFNTKEVLSYFPGEKREPVQSVERIGPSCYVVRDDGNRMPARVARGRPPYPWEGLHVQVAAMIKRGDLPIKKEAAIQHFQDWLEEKHGVKPSRAAVGEKLKPYYDHFIRSDRK